MKRLIPVAFLCASMAACNSNNNPFDASGTFETDETIISSEASGTLLTFRLEEGISLKKGDSIGYVDSTQLHLKRLQLEEQIKSVLSQKPDIPAQLASLEEELRSAKVDQKRIQALVSQEALPRKQLDDINTKVGVLKRQIDAMRSSLDVSSESITQQTSPLSVQIQQVEDQLTHCVIVNPVNGTVLAKYAEANEVVTPGKPLYRIADLSTLFLRAYITGDQLGQVKLNQKVRVLVDKGEKAYKEYAGTISWISDKAEFTPKTIQTKEERANLVYAMKVKVVNDGFLKIGMYGEVAFQ